MGKKNLPTPASWLVRCLSICELPVCTPIHPRGKIFAWPLSWFLSFQISMAHHQLEFCFVEIRAQIYIKFQEQCFTACTMDNLSQWLLPGRYVFHSAWTETRIQRQPPTWLPRVCRPRESLNWEDKCLLVETDIISTSFEWWVPVFQCMSSFSIVLLSCYLTPENLFLAS